MTSTPLDQHVSGPPPARLLAKGDGWRVSDVVCAQGPQDRTFEEQHRDVTIAAVLHGSFFYRGETGRSLMYPGALLLGNAGTCFECGHDHGTGDRCLSFHFSRPFFEEIATAAAGSPRFRFATNMLPALRQLAGPLVMVEAGALAADPIYLEELAIGFAEAVLAVLSDGSRAMGNLPARDRRRVSDVVRYIEDHADQPLGLSDLAGLACMSRYHFLRTFRQALGITPYQLLLNIRMRRAAVALATTPAEIAAIAFASGFGDLSTFNARFRTVTGMSPQAFRKSVASSGLSSHGGSRLQSKRFN
ncbi:helix-turn-helix transcriptional regulator [Aestuariivirga sp. YIM B02566]|uniref:Helix-turn-helix transcriptional regulator n=1 Tax=Taklimakanibacter albus TaxID=2800327 RepID=A0ACC5R462_9HYPH|nr:helix-turn-helix transcriptional regulator [Aestuariivirga sp. YIM B02566]